ncbi:MULTISPECIES: hypothetical protein [unclassified Luteococcus]|uniref:hypothetical protein n=1 Tax=unclassified Luteococcus TaxID=2639923 RepID=UPI00313E6FEC
MSLRLAAFDFDGTLTEIMAFHRRVEQGSADPLAMHRERFGALIGRFGSSVSVLEVVDRYREALLSHTLPLPGAAELLTGLAARGVRLATLGQLLQELSDPAA